MREAKNSTSSSFKKTLVKIEDKISGVVAHPYSLLIVIGLIAAWFFTKNILGYEYWIDSIHIPLVIASFILLFILQSSEKHDTDALHAKLDELIKTMPGADNSKVHLEKKLKGRK